MTHRSVSFTPGSERLIEGEFSKNWSSRTCAPTTEISKAKQGITRYDGSEFSIENTNEWF